MDILFKHADIITVDDNQFLIEKGYLGIEAGKIVYLSHEAPQTKAKKEIDATGKVLMPGLINTHTHMPTSLLRTIAEDLELEEWLYNYIFKAEARFDRKCLAVGTKLAIAEMIRTGTTSFSNMYYDLPLTAEILKESGMRGNLCNGAICLEGEYVGEEDSAFKEFIEVMENYHNLEDGRVKIDVGIHGEYTSNAKVWAFWSALAKQYQTNVHVHISETQKEHEQCKKRHNGKTPLQVLDSYGLFDTSATIAHAVWIEEEDRKLMAQKGISVAHNPVSNLKLASGIADLKALKAHGINVGLGTDGMASNNTYDLFEEMKVACLLAKGINLDPKIIVAEEVIKMATINGAKCQGRDNVGMLKEGYEADIIMIDFNNLNHMPNYNTVASIVYNTTGADVCMTMVNGRILYENGNFFTMDMDELIQDVKDYREKYDRLD